MNKNSNWGKLSVLGVGGLLLGGIAGYVVAPNGLDQVTYDKAVSDLKVVTDENTKLVSDNVLLNSNLVKVEGELTSEIDTSKLSQEDLGTVLNYVYDNYGEVSVLTEDLDNPEDIVERV